MPKYIAYPNIPNVIQESVFGKAGARCFDQAQPVQKRSPIRNKGRFCRSKGRDASAAKNSFLNHVRYNLKNLFLAALAIGFRTRLHLTAYSGCAISAPLCWFKLWAPAMPKPNFSSYLGICLIPFLSYAQEVACFGNPTGKLCNQSLGLEASAELLILQPFEENLAYAIRNDVRQTTGGADGTPGGPLIDLETRWQLGWRVCIGYSPSVTARAVWMGFSASTLGKAKSGITPSGIGLQSTWVPPVTTALLYESASFRWDLALNAVDIEVGKHYWVSSTLSINPTLALRLAEIDQAFHADYSLSGATDVARAMNDFQGLGPRAGTSLSWGFAHGWEIALAGAFSLLYGQFKTHYGVSPPFEMCDVDATFKRLVPNADLALGLGWGRCLSKNKWRLKFQFSYEGQIFWDQNQLRRPLGSDAPALAILQTGNLSLQGFSLRGQCEF